MRSHPALDRPPFEQLFSTLRMTILKFTPIYLQLWCEFGDSASHQAPALAPTIDHGGHRDVSHVRKPQITSLLTDWLPCCTWPCFRGVQSKLAVMIGTLDLMNSSFCIFSMGTWIVLPHAAPPGRAVNGRSTNRRPSLV